MSQINDWDVSTIHKGQIIRVSKVVKTNVTLLLSDCIQRSSLPAMTCHIHLYKMKLSMICLPLLGLRISWGLYLKATVNMHCSFLCVLHEPLATSVPGCPSTTSLVPSAVIKPSCPHSRLLSKAAAFSRKT
jgi:hypothetical protein